MWVVAITWIYVVGLMSLTEHSVVAGVMTFLGYCVLPLSILYYLAGSKRRRARNAASRGAQSGDQSGDHESPQPRDHSRAEDGRPRPSHGDSHSGGDASSSGDD